jgi:purine-cytosine permease-like protein
MLDIRIPIGLVFAIFGVLILAFGIATNSDPAMYVKSMQINVNLWSGIFMTVFGACMLVWVKLAKKK